MKTTKSYLVTLRFSNSQEVKTIFFHDLKCVQDYLTETANKVMRDFVINQVTKEPTPDFVFSIQTINSHVCEDNCDVCD